MEREATAQFREGYDLLGELLNGFNEDGWVIHQSDGGHHRDLGREAMDRMTNRLSALRDALVPLLAARPVVGRDLRAFLVAVLEVPECVDSSAGFDFEPVDELRKRARQLLIEGNT